MGFYATIGVSSSMGVMAFIRLSRRDVANRRTKSLIVEILSHSSAGCSTASKDTMAPTVRSPSR